MTAEFQVIELQVPAEMAGQRLDSALARLMPEHSRTRIKGWIEEGAVKVDRAACKPPDQPARPRRKPAPGGGAMVSSPDAGVTEEFMYQQVFDCDSESLPSTAASRLCGGT